MMQDRISPVPQRFELLEGGGVTLGAAGKAYCRIEASALPDSPLAHSAVKLIQDHIRGLLNAEAHGDIPIRLTLGEAPDDVKNPGQAYSLEVGADAVTVTGFGPLGLYYGAVTLTQCLRIEDNALRLPSLRVLDWPDFATRGHFMECRFGSNLMELDDWKYLVDDMAQKKMNQLVVGIYGCWCVQYDGRVSEYLYVPLCKYPELKTPVVIRYYSPSAGRWIDEEKLPPMFEQDFLGELMAYGNTLGVTVLPLFNSYGHNTLIPAAIPEVSSKNEQGGAELTGYCTSNPKTYEVLFSIYDEIIDRYLIPNGIYCFHVGLDEVWDGIAQNADDIYRIRSPWCRCGKCREIDRKKLFIDHAVRILKYLKGRGMRSIYMYADMLVGHGNALSQSCEDMMKALRDNDLTDVVVTDWWTYDAHREGLMFQTTHPELGLRRTVKPWNGYYHWTVLTDPLPNIRLLASMGAEEGAEGIQCYSAWDLSYDRNHAALGDCGWNSAGAGQPADMTARYARRLFAARSDEARRAFTLMDLCCESRREKYEDGSAVVSNYALLLSTLSYYFYSYVKADKPYPRIFPGEAVGRVADGGAGALRALHEIAAMAQKAGELFRDVAGDPRCDMAMADRYAYEADNYLCLAEDYLCLLSMMELAASGCPDKFNKIREAAGERKRARLALMARLEAVKEHFLMASHMRNHSIFMQFFADLEGYLASTPPADVRLDFLDMRRLQSEAFKKLR